MIPRIGQWVRHRGTLLWGQVLEVVPQRDGTTENLIRYEDPPWYASSDGTAWWASYHINVVMDTQPTEQEKRWGGPLERVARVS